MASSDNIRGFNAKAQERKRRMDSDGGGDAKRAHMEDFSARLHAHALGCVASMLALPDLAHFACVTRTWHAALRQPRVVALELRRSLAVVPRVTGVLAQHVVKLSVYDTQRPVLLAPVLKSIVENMPRMAHLSLILRRIVDVDVDLAPLACLPCLTFLRFDDVIRDVDAAVLVGCPVLLNLHVRQLSSLAEQVLLAKRPSWTALGVDRSHAEQDWALLASALPALTHLEMAPNGAADVGQLPVRLQTLKIAMNLLADESVMDTFVNAHLRAFVNVRTLHLDGRRLRYPQPSHSSDLTSEQLDVAFACMPLLTDLTLESFHHVTDMNFLRPLRALERLVLDGVELGAFDPASLAHLAHLRVLAVMNCQVEELTFLQPVAPTLTRLTLETTLVHTDAANLQMLASLKQVTHMTLRDAFARAPSASEMLLFTPPNRALVLPRLQQLLGTVPGADAQ
jgi:hypothetical protein